MEQMNKVEIAGSVGAISNLTKSGFGVDATRISVATNYAYMNKDGYPTIETTWHDVVAYNTDEWVKNLKRGDNVHIIGRLRSQRYTDNNGKTTQITTIVAAFIEKVSEVPQMEVAESLN